MAALTQILIAHPELFQVAKEHAGTEVYSKLLTLKPFSKGQTIAKIENVTYIGSKKWSTIQTGKNMHAEINDELVCMNHSCNPSVIVDVQSMEVKANRDLVPGDELTFFYPSTEWKMASPFVCTCESAQCLQVIAGAEHIPIVKLKKYHINQHIVEMITELLATNNPHIVLEHKQE